MTHEGDDASKDSTASFDSASENSGKHVGSALDFEQRLTGLWQLDSPFSRSPSSPQERFLAGHIIRKALGGDAFGIAYLADDLEHDREVALKVSRPEVRLHEKNREYFVNEAVLAARLVLC